jgi:hypothetical protein
MFLSGGVKLYARNILFILNQVPYEEGDKRNGETYLSKCVLPGPGQEMSQLPWKSFRVYFRIENDIYPTKKAEDKKCK